MYITLMRDSVAMGDDIHAPHCLQLELPDGATLLELLHPNGPLSTYLPCVQGMCTLWAVRVHGHQVAQLRHCGETTPRLQATLRASDRSLDEQAIYLQAIGQQAWTGQGLTPVQR